MILQKTCHDMDILAWLIGKKCTSVQSFGSLSYFTPENAPEGAPERCIEGCPHADICPYNAIKLYVDDKGDWFRCAATKVIHPTDEQVIEALWNTQYGKCVYKCNNNVVDHQTVNMKFGDDVYVDFAMSAFTRGGRVIRIMGTKGEINATMDGEKIEVYNFITRKSRMHDCNSNATGEGITSGHGGGDEGIVYALRELLNGNPSKSICSVGESADNHMISFAAEQSRLEGGRLIEMDTFEK
jgi:predicted dehydrogenase